MATSKKNETKTVIIQQLIQKNGTYYDKHENKLFTGIAFEPRLNKDNPFDLSNKIAERTFLDGKLDGLSTWFSCNGEKKLQMQFKQGALHGRCEQFLQSGEETIVKIQNFKNGTLNGDSQWLRQDGQLIKIETYVDGLRDGPRFDYFRREIAKTTSIKKQGNYSGGVPDGLWQNYYPGDILKRTGLYKMGRRHGLWEWFYQNKEPMPMYSMLYKHGKLHGRLLSFHRKMKLNGQPDVRTTATNHYQFQEGRYISKMSPELETEGMFINSKREGLWQRFYPDGKILCRARYKKGAIIEWECFDSLGQPEPLNMVISNKRKPYIDVIQNTYREHANGCDCDLHDDDIPF